MVSISALNNVIMAKGKTGKAKNPSGGGGRYNQVVMAPVAQNRSSGQTSGKSLRFKECERIGTVLGSVNFGITGNVVCNPGLPTSFPWLSGHANLYERYKIHKLVYRYKNLKGTQSDGNILMSFDYDVGDATPTSAVEMTQATVYSDGAPWRVFELVVPPDNRDLFTRRGNKTGVDLKMYDMGKLIVGSEGCTTNTAHGYLEVEYDIELFMKQTYNSPASSSVGGVIVGGQLTGLSGFLTKINDSEYSAVAGAYSIQNHSGDIIEIQLQTPEFPDGGVIAEGGNLIVVSSTTFIIIAGPGASTLQCSIIRTG